jgi:glycerol kinase
VASFVAAIDQGTTSTRFMVFDAGGNEVGRHQLEHTQVLPRPGWVEHDPVEIWRNTTPAIDATMRDLRLRPSDLVALGITNQRETTVVWNRHTGRPYYNAIVWQDTRTDQIVAALEADGQADFVRDRTGLPLATYFSAGKLAWILRTVDGVRADAERGDALFGTVDSWLLWNLTGGVHGGTHVTDVTNAGRTQLLNLQTLSWDDRLLDLFRIPAAMLPAIRPSSDPAAFGTATEPEAIAGVAVTAALGDQHAAMIGQLCLQPGQAKNTYGTGSFLLHNTGTEIVRSTHGLLTTICYQFAGSPAVYALEGSIAVTGSAVQWLRDQLGVIGTAAEVEALAGEVDDTGGVYFVPAFSGLFAPYWNAAARGAIVGLSRFSSRAHIARATLEAIGYQTRDVVDAMHDDSGVELDLLKVDGGVSANGLCMQLQADILGVPVSRPTVLETTSLGAAYAAGLAVGFFADAASLRTNWHEDRRFEPRRSADQREQGYAGWRAAVARTS